ncbi:hypothetical protein TSUD_293980 [Trifolium subterraneum]|uniref:eRF1 domain-containing protein n=1 Tax=Trifolium subterraneum TaxID=3900 RepID=A0A2Z6M8J3_TRISU|nr:hypothetical protein TSUD_293980 [Trifolium subterraneum]
MVDVHHTDKLKKSEDKFGFIVINRNGTVFGTLKGNTREVLYKLHVDLRDGRGREPVLLFSRARMEKRLNHVKKTAELATLLYINPATSQPNVSGLILAGPDDYYKTALIESDMFNPLLKANILGVVDVSKSYVGDYGFNEAIELSSEILSKAKFTQEKCLSE